MADTQKAEFTLHKPMRVRLEFNGKEVYNQELAVGSHVLNFDGIVPHEKGTVVLFLGKMRFGRWDVS
jgi:hypothetical protein